MGGFITNKQEKNMRIVLLSLIGIIAVILYLSFIYYSFLKYPSSRRQFQLLIATITAFILIVLGIPVFINPQTSAIALLLALISTGLIAAKNARILKAKTHSQLTIIHKGKEYQVKVQDIDEPNAYTTLNGEIMVTKKLTQILDKKELEAIILHEIGHLKNKLLLRLTTLSVAMRATLLPYITLILGLSAANAFLSQINSKILTILTSTLYILYTASLFTTITYWINEHEADAYAAQNSNPTTFIQALTKTTACARLRELCNKQALQHIQPPNPTKPSYTQILKETAKQALETPLTLPELLKKPPIPPHPPLKLRIQALVKKIQIP